MYGIGGGGGGNSHLKGARMLVVSLRGVNFGFWSHLGCSGQYAVIFSRKSLFKGFRDFYLITISVYR